MSVATEINFEIAHQFAKYGQTAIGGIHCPDRQKVLQDEVDEAYEECDYKPLRAELIQVAACAVSWIQYLDDHEQEQE